MTTEQRRAELVRRGGLDPVMLDTRPLHQIMNDEIPYAKFDRQLRLINRAGYPTVIDWLKAKHGKKRARGSEKVELFHLRKNLDRIHQ